MACLQEWQIFEELAEELEVEAPGFVDLRDRAGWSENGDQSAPKMAALVADARLIAPPIKLFDIQSDGRCLILGAQNVALAAAARLSEVLNVTVLLEQFDDLPMRRDFDVVVGRVRAVSGSLGRFEVKIDGLQMVEPGGRGTPQLSPARAGGHTECDLILDLRGETALLHHKRDGYLRADPRHNDAVAKVVLEASQLVGSFEKPFYVTLDAPICAHSRAGITGCTKCINACEAGAISPDGDSVAIDPLICAGCGGCAAVCPSGAITFETPSFGFLLQRLETIARTYADAGGKSPRLLVHDAVYGGEMISLAARFGRGLPADVIPLEVESLSSFGHAEMLAALGCGFTNVDLLLGPKTERTERPVLESALALALAISGNAVIRLLDLNDPDALSDALFDQEVARPVARVLPIGNRRQVTRLVAKALQPTMGTPIELPEGAPYGAVEVDRDACTLCLSCVSLCPSGALMDNEDAPQLLFQEDACLQCGICAHACPENAIRLVPQLDVSDGALSQWVLNEEEPFACISCGSLFGVKSTVNRIMDKLAGKHAMFATSEQGKLIQMCDKCRVEAQYHSETSPFQAAPRPRTRTTDDYLKRRDH